MTDIRKHYVDSSFGQIHARTLSSRGEATAAPLVCLHPAPYSGHYFSTVMPLLNENRVVIAFDYPGYGGSDKALIEPSISDYAHAVLEATNGIGVDSPVDVLGFHTGCLVAAEMAIVSSRKIHRLLLCDIPYFTREEQDAMREKVVRPRAISSELSCLQDNWNFDVATRLDDMSLERAFQLFTEHLRAGQSDHKAFAAAFSYDCEGRFSKIASDVVCMATQSGLRDATVAAHKAIPAASFVDIAEISSAVFEAGATAISCRIIAALDE